MRIQNRRRFSSPVPTVAPPLSTAVSRYDPSCGSAGMFAQSEKFVEAHRGRIGDIAVHGQESNSTTRRLAMMNRTIRGSKGNLGPEHADTLCRDLHKDLKPDRVLASLPFNDAKSHSLEDENARSTHAVQTYSWRDSENHRGFDSHKRLIVYWTF